MKDLIKALQIFLKYGNPSYPTHCIHDKLLIVGIKPENISDSDKKELKTLGFSIQIAGVYDEENDFMPSETEIYSFKYGSA